MLVNWLLGPKHDFSLEALKPAKEVCSHAYDRPCLMKPVNTNPDRERVVVLGSGEQSS
jgi:hypothetical protein